VASTPADGHGRALRLHGTAVGTDGYVGVWVALHERGRAVDVSAFDGIRLRLRGAGDWLVGLRAGNGPALANFQRPVKGSAMWTRVDVPFATLVPSGAPPKE